MYANTGSGGRGRPYWSRDEQGAPKRSTRHQKGAEATVGDARDEPVQADDVAERRARESTRLRGASRMREPLAFALVSVLALFSGAGCRREATNASQLTFALESEPERLSPLTIQNPQTFRVAWQIYEGLLGLSPSGDIQPRLAESWRTADYRTWVFSLRRNATFHRSDIFGQEGTRGVTADDVVWSFQSFCGPGAYASFVLMDSLRGCAEYNAGKAASVSGLRALDSHTVEITLLGPEPFFLNRLTTAWVAVFPRESQRADVKERWGLAAAVGTGPFRLLSRSDNEIVLERNPDYWDVSRPVGVERVVFRVIKSDQLRLAEMERGTIDVMVVPPQMLAALASGGRLSGTQQTVWSKEIRTFNHHFIGFNLARVPDAHLRRAMSLATDRREIVSRLRSGYADVTGGPVPPVMTGFRSSIPEPLFDIDAARQELAKSTYKGEALELIVHDLGGSEQIGSVFQQQMKALGVEIKLTKLDFGSAIGRIIKGETSLFCMFAEIVFSSPEPLLFNLFSTSKIPVPNFWKYSNPKVDEALEGLRSMESPQARLDKCSEIERSVIQDAPAVFLFSGRQVVLLSKRVAELPINPHEHFQLEGVRFRR